MNKSSINKIKLNRKQKNEIINAIFLYLDNIEKLHKLFKKSDFLFQENKNKKFYKFYSVDNIHYLLDSLEKKYTYFSNIESFKNNDNSELYFEFELTREDVNEIDLSREQLESFFSKEITEKILFLLELLPKELLAELIYNFLISCQLSLNKMIKVFCLTKTFDNNQMWKNYAQNSKGICIEYKILDLNKNFFNKISYTNKNKVIKLKQLFPNDTNEMLSSLTESLFLKDKDYSNEKEYRLVNFEPKNKQKQILQPTKLILGQDFDYNLEISKLLIKKFKELNIPIYKYNTIGKINKLNDDVLNFKES